jgi:hypothetical protein
VNDDQIRVALWHGAGNSFCAGKMDFPAGLAAANQRLDALYGND